MKYKFVKLRLTTINGNPIKPLEYPWMLVVDSVDVLNDYMQSYQSSIITLGLSKLLSKHRPGHCTNSWEQITEVTADCRGTDIITVSADVESRVYWSRLDSISKFGKIYLNSSGAGFPHTDDLEVIDLVKKDNIAFPFFTKKDIKIIKWPSGIHFYAKIGYIDVEDDQGNQRWNTGEKAYEVASNYLKRLI